ncbi:MAG: universal stress protein [Defluviicoccus sp.]
MSIKSIVAIVRDDAALEPMLKTAVALTRRLEGHLTVGHIVPPAHMPAGAIGRAAAMEYVTEANETADAKADRLHGKVDALCTPHLKSWEWWVEHGDELEAASRLVEMADLVIVEQRVQGVIEDLMTTDVIEHLLARGDGPVLMLPIGWRGGPVGEKILVAWKPTREAKRAVHDAIPLLERAQDVFVLAASEPRSDAAAGSDVASYLAHHGVQAQIVGESDDGDGDITATARNRGCDLIVMGAFHRSSLTELVFGGATKFMMRHSKLPVLLRH